MTGEALDLRPTIDRAWLERVAVDDPVTHAYAIWDLGHHPDRIRLVSAVVGEETLGYLLIWLGHPAAPVVHWVGTDPRLLALARGLPARPMVAIVPVEFRSPVQQTRGPAREFPLLSMLAGDVRPAGARPETAIRRLQRADRAVLAPWAVRQEDTVVAEYSTFDPEGEHLWGAFEDARLVGVIRAAVRLPTVWVLGGVYVEPAARGEGWGRALVETALTAAIASGARLALYVREDRTPARLLYESLGFRAIGRRVWLDAGSGLAP